jgi:hypothetical protein
MPGIEPRSFSAVRRYIISIHDDDDDDDDYYYYYYYYYYFRLSLDIVVPSIDWRHAMGTTSANASDEVTVNDESSGI